MFPNQFDYRKPSTVQEAIAILSSDPDAKILAGGHSLLPAMKLRLASPSTLVDLGGVKGLKGISVNGGAKIGAMTTYAEIRDSKELAKAFPLLGEVANNVGDAQVQNKGTLGGALTHSDPAADFTAVVLAMGGSVKAVGPKGERTISADDLFVDLLTTSLAADEVLTEVSLPGRAGKTGMAYEKVHHPASGYAVVGVAVVIPTGTDGVPDSVRIAVTGATSKATRATAAEKILSGKKLTAENIAAAADAVADGLELNGDHYASAGFRKQLLKVHAKRAIERAAAQVS